jgi:hypothetical protein
MNYYDDDLEEAYRCQKMAVDTNCQNRVDRHYNLSAIAAKLFSRHPNRQELLNEATKELQIVLDKGSRWDARNALGDNDFAAVFTASPAMRDLFRRRAEVAADDGSG